MSLVIRFSNDGKRGERKYKLVVCEKRSRREGRPLELLGRYEKRVGNIIDKKIDRERVEYWISKGAQIAPNVKSAIE